LCRIVLSCFPIREDDRFNDMRRATLRALADIERHLQVAFSICNAVQQALSGQCDEHSADFGLALRWGVADAIALECERLRALAHDLGSASRRTDASLRSRSDVNQRFARTSVETGTACGVE